MKIMVSRSDSTANRRRRPTAAVVPIRLGALLATMVVLAGCSNGSTSPSAAGRSSSGAPVGQATTVEPQVGQSTRPTTPGADVGAQAFPYQPLWPFASAAQAQAWQASERSGGHQPWHLDPAGTALSFTRYFLGFAGVDRVLASTITGDDARVQVGYATEGGRTGVAAVIHLVRFGSGTDAPWEVVGTDDSTISLTQPAYGSTVTVPLTVGGRISGVDESIHVWVRSTSGTDVGQVVGEFCCQPAGGDNSVWTTTVSTTAPPGQSLVVVASTGGHLYDVERFTVTGVRLAG
ncbi:hypothetical protein [Frankia sp. Cas4]|uniref:hypothetical protein n=1 Tax=Frankia sp. Cas4 TaxID=3073927 RepID=UPI002AD526E1|nr:hypothetical protein [Frankia sp. Cas4]